MSATSIGVPAPRAARLGEGAHDVDTVLGEQHDPVALVMDDRPRQQAAEHLGGRLERITEQLMPRASGVAAESVFEEQHEVVVVAAEHAVVQGLAIVRIRSGLEQEPGEGDGVGMRRLVALAVAEHPVRTVNGVGSACQNRPSLGSAPASSKSRAVSSVAARPT